VLGRPLKSCLRCFNKKPIKRMTENNDSEPRTQHPGHGQTLVHVPRINQLDAATLDEELFTSFSQKIGDAFKYFLRNPLDTIRPELELLVRCAVWKCSVLDHSRSIGQSLLGIKYDTASNQSRRLWFLAGLDILSHYITQRQSSLVDKLPGTQNTKFYILHKLSLISSFVEIVNTALFLRQGLYPSVPLMLLDIKPVSTIEESRSVGYSYMSRELLWSTFSELLMFLIPVLNVNRLQKVLGQKINQYLGSGAQHEADNDGPSSLGLGLANGWQCVACCQAPIIPTRGRCGHLFCHVCVFTIKRCAVCDLEIDTSKLNYLS